MFGRFKEVNRREEGKKAKAKLEREIKGAHMLGRRKVPNFQRWVAKGQSEGWAERLGPGRQRERCNNRSWLQRSEQVLLGGDREVRGHLYMNNKVQGKKWAAKSQQLLCMLMASHSNTKKSLSFSVSGFSPSLQLAQSTLQAQPQEESVSVCMCAHESMSQFSILQRDNSR